MMNMPTTTTTTNDQQLKEEGAAYESWTLMSLRMLAVKIRRLSSTVQNQGYATVLLEIADELDAILARTSVMWDRVEALGEKIAKADEQKWTEARDRAGAIVLSFLDLVRARPNITAAEAFEGMVQAVSASLVAAERNLDHHRPVLVLALERLYGESDSEEESRAAQEALAALR